MDLSDLDRITAREVQQRTPFRICCTAAGCTSAGSKAVVERLQQTVQDGGFAGQVQIAEVGCMRLCSQGPLVQVDPQEVMYKKVTSETAPSLVAGFQGGQSKLIPATCRPHSLHCSRRSSWRTAAASSQNASKPISL